MQRFKFHRRANEAQELALPVVLKYRQELKKRPGETVGDEAL